MWAVAAAWLQPEKASTILHATLERFQGQYEAPNRYTLCVALWQLAGEAESQYLLDWLYREKPQGGEFEGWRAKFIDIVGKDPKGRKFIARIIRDRRFDTLEEGSLRNLVHVVNRWLKMPAVTEDEIQKISRPMSEETGESWRARLRASVPQWLP
jgi:hypothetical protein